MPDAGWKQACKDIPVWAALSSRDAAERLSHRWDVADHARAPRLPTKRQKGVLFLLLLNTGLENTREPSGTLELTLPASFGKCTL